MDPAAAAAALAAVAAASNGAGTSKHGFPALMSKYNLENYSTKSIDESKASVYFTPNDGHLSPELPLQLQVSPIHINYINDCTMGESSGMASLGLLGGDTPKSFKSVLGGAAGGSGMLPIVAAAGGDGMVVRSILKPPGKFVYDRNLQKYRMCYQPNRLSGGYVGDEMDESMRYECYNDALEGGDSCDDEGNYSLKHTRKHKRKRKAVGRPAGGKQLCEYETLLMKNLGSDPKEGHYKIIHINKLGGGVAAGPVGSGWTAGRAINRKKLPNNSDYYNSLEDMIQDNNEKIRKLIYDSKIDIMNEVITGSNSRDKVSSSSSTSCRGNLHFENREAERLNRSSVAVDVIIRQNVPTTANVVARSNSNSSSNNNSQMNSGCDSRDSPSTTQNLNYHQPLKKIHKLHFDSSTNRIQQSTSLPEICFGCSPSSSSPTLMHNSAVVGQPSNALTTTSNKSSNQSIVQQQTLSSASSTGSNVAHPPLPLPPNSYHQPKVHGKHVILAVENIGPGDDSSVPPSPKPDASK